MKLTEHNLNIENNLEAESSEFTIAANSKMFDILSSKIYEDPIRAIVRELSCNAIDANIEANNLSPFKVYLPIKSHQSLIIEDNGIGMTHEDVMTVYKSYGKSTKSNSNKVIGALGLGGKTPLAYTNQFTLITAKDGLKNNYIIFKDERGIPNVTHVGKEECDISGTTVELIVKPEDIEKFYIASIKTFVFFDKMPIIKRGEKEFYETIEASFTSSYGRSSIDIIKQTYEKVREMLKTDFMPGKNVTNEFFIRKLSDHYNSEYGIVMGQVYYDVNIKQIINEIYGSSVAKTAADFPNIYVAKPKKILHVPLGSVSIQPSRESLNYNQVTIDFLKKKFYADFEKWLDELHKKAVTPVDFLANITTHV